MNFYKEIKDKYYERRATSLVRTGAFDEALGYIKIISSYEKQRKILFRILSYYTVSILLKESGREFTVHYTQDREEYEHLRTVAGPEVILYKDPETNRIEGLEDFIKKVIPQDNLLLKHLKHLDEMNKPTL